jgi:hypothetical protein
MGKTLRGLVAIAAGGLLAITVAAPALADDRRIDLDQPGDVPTTAPDFNPNDECDRIFADKADNEDGWHFVLTQFAGDEDDVTLSFNFLNGNGDPVALNHPGNLSNFTHEFDKTGGVLHLWLLTPAGWTLQGASAEAAEELFPSGNPQLNLSHTCAGEPDEPGTEPTPTPTPTEPGKEPGEPGDENGGGGEDEGGKLPVTGMQVGTLVGVGVVLLAAGGGTMALMAIRRRRSISDLMDG